MKRCPTCNRSFDDDTLSFCLEDGTPLVRDSASRADSQETIVTPSRAASQETLVTPSRAASQETLVTPSRAASQETLVSPSPSVLPPSQFPGTAAAQPYGPPPKSRRIWPWIVAILAILLLMIVAVVGAIVIPPMLQASNNDNRARPTPSQSVSTTTPTPDAAPTERWGAPDDKDEVLAQLTKLEEEWAEANVKGDKAALERILADEYVGSDYGQNKREYIDTLTHDPSIKSWELSDGTVELDGDRATYKGTLTTETTKGTEVYGFTDKFVWRDNRWQAVASKTTRVR
jgi:hypothetical protein